MTRSGGGHHLKRLAISKHIPVFKKAFKYTVRPSPGPHAASECIPLAIILRDMFGYARNMSEVKRIINERITVVDGRIRRNRKYPVGFMDVISFPKINEHYRMVYLPGKGLRTITITEDEAKIKLCQIKNKSTIKGGLTQLNLHDGRNIILTPEEQAARNYSTYDTIKITLPSQKILENFELKTGNYGIVTSGRWMGRHGIIEDISTHQTKNVRTVTIKSSSGDLIVTLFRYIFVVGNKDPSISMFEKVGDGK